MTRRRVRLSDIADRTGFGTNTVSLALRNSSLVTEETKGIIQRAARELNYVPNYVAKSLALDRTNTIGLVLHDVTNPVFTAAAKAIQLELAARGYSVLFATSNGSFEEELLAIERFQRHLVDGILIYPLVHDRIDHLIRLRQQGFPVVLLIGTKDAPIDAVGVDEYGGAVLATQHLIDLGHRRIGIVTSEVNSEKLRGYASALEEAGIEFDRSIVGYPHMRGIEGGIDATAAIMSSREPPTAIFAGSDRYAVGVLRWATIHGVSVPGDLSIVGFDDTEFAKFGVIPLSTIKNDVEAVSRKAVERLCALMDRRQAMPEPVTTLVDGTLITRDSSRVRLPAAPRAR